MYAVVQAGGRQYRVAEGDTIIIDRLKGDPAAGSTVDLDQVLVIGGENASYGAPFVSGAKVVAEVIGHDRGPKIDIFKYQRRKNYRKSMGFRAARTTLKIQSIVAG